MLGFAVTLACWVGSCSTRDVLKVNFHTNGRLVRYHVQVVSSPGEVTICRFTAVAPVTEAEEQLQGERDDWEFGDSGCPRSAWWRRTPRALYIYFSQPAPTGL